MPNLRTFLSRHVRGIVSIVLCAAALAAGVASFLWLKSLKAPPQGREAAERVFNVEVFDVERVDLQEIVSGFGTARADREVVVSAKVAGEVVDVHPRLKVGEAVKAAEIVVGLAGESKRPSGDLLLRIDPELYAERAAQVESQIVADRVELKHLDQEEKNNARLLAKATTDYETFQKEHDRIKDLREKGVASQSDLTRIVLELQQYEDAVIRHQNEKSLIPTRREQILSRLGTHQADKRLAELDLGHTEVRPPFAGALSEVTVERGQYVRPGDPLLKLTDLTAVEVAVPLTLADYAKLSPEVLAGRHPAVQLAENETTPPRWHGYVVRVAPQADELTRTIKVYVHVDNRQQAVQLLPGTFVHARIDGPVLRDAVVVPRDAVAGGTVYVATNGTASARAAAVSQTLQSLAVIDGGLDSGDRVILTNLDSIRDGTAVQIQGHRTLEEELKRQRIRAARQVAGVGD